MKLLWTAVIILCGVACQHENAPEQKPQARVLETLHLLDFEEQTGAFHCRVPADWKVLEGHAAGGPSVQFFSPVTPRHPQPASIRVARYPNGIDRIRTPDDYRRTRAHGRQYPGEETALIPAGASFYEVIFAAPEDTRAAMRPVFDALTRSFTPRTATTSGSAK